MHGGGLFGPGGPLSFASGLREAVRDDRTGFAGYLHGAKRTTKGSNCASREGGGSSGKQGTAADDHVPLALADASSTDGSCGVMSSRFHFDGSKGRWVSAWTG